MGIILSRASVRFDDIAPTKPIDNEKNVSSLSLAKIMQKAEEQFGSNEHKIAILDKIKEWLGPGYENVVSYGKTPMVFFDEHAGKQRNLPEGVAEQAKSFILTLPGIDFSEK